MKYSYYLIFLFGFIFPILSGAQNLNFKDKNYSFEIKSAIQELEKNNNEIAKKILSSIIKKMPDHDEANYWLGLIELKSEDKIDSERKALKYFEISAKSGNELAIFNVAKIKLFGLNEVNIDKEEGQKLTDHLLSIDSNYGNILRYNIFIIGGHKPFNVQKEMFNAIQLAKKGLYNSALDIFSKKIFGDSLYISNNEKISWLHHLKISKLNSISENEIDEKIQEIKNEVPNMNLEVIDLVNLIANTEKYLIDRKNFIGEIEPRDLITEGWQQFVGYRGIVNEPLAQYLTEEGLRLAIITKDKYAIDIARNNLGVILVGSFNKYIRNERLGLVHLYDAFDSYWAPENLIWSNYQKTILVDDKKIKILKDRYYQENNKLHITDSMQSIPTQFIRNPEKIKEFMIEEYYRNNKDKEIAAQIAEYIEDNNNILNLDEALIWIEKSMEDGDLIADHVRYKRINLILKNKYVKDFPDLSSAIPHLFELTDNSRGKQNFTNLNNLNDRNNLINNLKNKNYGLNSKNKNHALVIGNSNYKSKVLKNAVNDSETIAKKLRSYGFEVTHLKNLNRRDFNKGLIDFTNKAQGADLTLFFFAGHGIQMGGLNYILPIDIDLDDSVEIVTYEGININDVIRRNMPGLTKLIFLDACRSNPFKTAVTRGTSDGLAPINAPRGTLISFATKDGGVAFDGVGGKNSPYSIALAKNLDANEDISIVLRQVRDEVMLLTKNKQEPWEYGALSGGKIIISKLNN